VSKESSVSTSPEISHAEVDSDGRPVTFYHLTPLSNVTSILREGLKCTFGNYFSSTIEHAGGLMTFHIITMPEATEWAAIEVDPSMVEYEQSNDHSASFFGTDDSWVVWEPVPPEAIVNVWKIEFGN